MLAVYTCFYGTSSNWAHHIPPLPDGLEGYYFTNNPDTYAHVATTRWKVLWADVPMSDDDLVCAMQTKHLRCCPHDYPILQPYRYLCWIDSKLRVTSVPALREMVHTLDSSDAVWAFTRHPLPYTDVWGEYREAIRCEKYARERERYHAYIESRLKAGYVESRPQRVCCGFSIRKQGPRVQAIGDAWYREIQECGIEDQISFQFIHQNHEDSILMFPYQHCWSYI